MDIMMPEMDVLKQPENQRKSKMEEPPDYCAYSKGNER
jgi:hypothetical protein